MQLALIAAVARNGVIGRDNDLPWRLSSDLRRFKQLTLGKAMIMGRRTWESLGRPLAGRQSIVVSRTRGLELPRGVIRVGGFEEGLAAARSWAEREAEASRREAMVIGGASLYAAALPLADRLYLTEVEAEVKGDVYFPPFDRARFEVEVEERVAAGDRDEYPTTFRVYVRRR